MLFSDFVGMPMCVRNMEIKKVFKVAVVMMINDLMSVYQLPDVEVSTNPFPGQRDVQSMVDVLWRVFVW